MNFKKFKDFIKIFVFKFLLGLVDVVTDCISGHNFLTRHFLIGLYFASKTRDHFQNHEDDSEPWGYLTLCLVWFPGLVRIIILAFSQTWKDQTPRGIFMRILRYCYLFAIWPIFSISMLLLGLTENGKEKRVVFLEMEWSYEDAVVAKGYECFLEAGFQTLLQTYIQMRTNWPYFRTLRKGYILNEDFAAGEVSVDQIGWQYQDFPFTLIQLLGILSYPMSIVSLLLGSISWHYHHKENILDSLTLLEKIKVSPFFVFIIVTKVWVMADTCNTLHWTTEFWACDGCWLLTHIITFLPLMIALIVQLIMHVKTKFTVKQSCLGSMANIVSLGRPTLDESKNKAVSILYCRETTFTSIYYMVLSLLSILLKVIFPSANYQTWTSYAAVALTVTYILITKLYTNYLSWIVFHETDNDGSRAIPTVGEEMDKGVETFQMSEDKKNSMGVKRFRVPRKISRQVTRAIEKDRWVRISAVVSTITFLIAIISLGLLVQSNTDWHAFNNTRTVHADDNFVILQCTRDRNDLTIKVEDGKTYMIHSCWKLRLWVAGNGTEKIKVILLTVNTVEINSITASDVNIYSDAKETTVRNLKLPLLSIRLNALDTKVVIESALLNSNNQSLTITDADHILFKNTNIKDATVTTSFTNTIEFKTSNASDFVWTADRIQHLKVTDSSTIRPNLTQLNCKYVGGSPVRNFCPDTKVEISNNSFINKHGNTYGKSLDIKEFFSVEEVFQDLKFRDINVNDKCTKPCFGTESVRYELERSVKFNNIRRVEKLLDSNIQYISGLLPIAVKSNSLFMVEYLINRSPAVVNERSQYGRTALFWASLFKHFEVAELLVDNGADVNVQDNLTSINGGGTALIWSTQFDAHKVARLLIANKADMFKAKNDGAQAIHVAARFNAFEVLRELVQNGVNVDEPNPFGTTPLAFAAQYNTPWSPVPNKGLTYLVENGAFINNKGEQGKTPLIWASEENAIENVEYLIKNCADTNLTNRNGQTPLSIAQDKRKKEPKYSALVALLKNTTYITSVQSNCTKYEVREVSALSSPHRIDILKTFLIPFLAKRFSMAETDVQELFYPYE